MTMPKAMPRGRRQELFDRTGGTCEWCGRGMAIEDMDMHHRKLRSALGGWELSNLLGVHHLCHTADGGWGSIHGNVAAAVSRGGIVRVFDDPREVPVVDYKGARGWAVRLTDEGEVETA